MESDIGRLEKIIRERAMRDFVQRLDKTANSFANEYLHIGYATHFDIKGVKLSASEAFAAIKQAVVERERKSVEEKAISDWLKKIDAIQSQVDEIREGIEGN